MQVERLRLGPADRVDREGLERRAVGEHAGIGAGHLKQRHLGRSERQARHVRQVRGDAELARGRDHRRNAELVAELGGDGVDREREGGAQGQRSAEAVVGILRLPVADLDRAVHQHGIRAQPLRIGGEIDEELEQGAGLALGLNGAVELAVLVVAPAHHGQDRALRRQGDEGGLARLLLRALRVEAPGDHALGEALQVEVEGRAHGDVAARIGEALGVGGDHVEEVVGAGRRLRGRAQGHGLGARRIRLLRRDGAGLDHRLEHHVGALLGAAEIAGGGELRGRAHQAGQHRRLGQAHLLGGLAEIAPCRRIDAVGAGPEIGGVEVAEQDVALRHLALGAHRQERLLDLAPERLLLGQRGQPDILLRDGRAALAHAAAERVAPGRPRQAAQIHAPMAVEAPVLDGDDGLGEVGRQVGGGERLAPEDAAGGEDAPVIGLDGERPAARIGRHRAERRQGQEGREHVAEEREQRHGQQGDAGEGRLGPAPSPPGRGLDGRAGARRRR
ncbi:hypothetical protein MET9862_04392 [Methylobacterium symbioticum]|uniref:Uncharacterized protein n=1 Tax=Methylobacterium symbioticum TaxID=2584084 RepID=A0A509EI64_9HYPH|nr:hypothetical protein MET9862_04392 [Methylobacterium symbioticum]